MIKTVVISILALTIGLGAAAKPAAKKANSKSAQAKTTGAKEVNEVLAAYRKAPGIKAGIKKTVVQEAMGTETKGQGEFYFAKGKLRMDIQSPEKSTLVYDGKIVWFESRLEGLDGGDETIQVTKMKTGKLKKTDSLMATLFEEKDILNTFKLTNSATDKSGVKTFAFQPKDKKKTEVQLLEIGLKNKDIQRIMYRDQVENKVSFEFSNMTKGSVSADKFKYVLPKKAEVTEI